MAASWVVYISLLERLIGRRRRHRECNITDKYRPAWKQKFLPKKKRKQAQPIRGTRRLMIVLVGRPLFVLQLFRLHVHCDSRLILPTVNLNDFNFNWCECWFRVTIFFSQTFSQKVHEVRTPLTPIGLSFLMHLTVSLKMFIVFVMISFFFFSFPESVINGSQFSTQSS